MKSKVYLNKSPVETSPSNSHFFSLFGSKHRFPCWKLLGVYRRRFAWKNRRQF